MNNLLQQRIYYSQNREDLILEAFFPDVKDGFYVDVGANDPEIDSVTKLFYDQGWSGINIEPIARHFAALKAQRPRDITLNIGLGDTESTLTFHEYTSGDGLSTFSDEIMRQYDPEANELYRDRKEYTVKVKTLRDILTTHKIKKIHFMKVDVEGFEYNVLAGNDWRRFRPEVICIEANHIIKDWRPLLKKHDYSLVFFDGLNEYYADAHTSRAEQFDFVNRVVIDKGGGLRFSDYTLIKELQGEVLQDSQQSLLLAQQTIQKILKAKSEQDVLHQQLLAENHRNHMRAVIAERALRHPLAFIKYQLKRGHHFILRVVSPRPGPHHTQDEKRAMRQALDELARVKTDERRLAAVQHVAALETQRLERVFRTHESQPLALTLYMRVVAFAKRLRLKGQAK